ncbi:MAG: MarR family winged helix-turn-helix transcriptional regulator [Sandaracinaceae bacterium]
MSGEEGSEARPRLSTAALLRFRRGHLGRLLREVSRDFSLRLDARLAALGHRGVKPAHTQVFTALPLAGARLTELADRVGITKQSMGVLVRELVRLGYLERQPDPRDGRASVIRFSPRGVALLEDAVAATRTVEAEYATAIGEARVAELRGALADLVEALGLDVPA